MKLVPSLLGLSLLIPISGCISYRAIPIDRGLKATAVALHRELDGLHVAVKDVTGPRDSTPLFGQDLVASGIAPVLLLVELDPRSKSSFSLRRDDARLCLRSGEHLKPLDPQEAATRVRYSHLRSVVGFLFLVPGFFIASSVNGANEQLRIDYGEKSASDLRVHESSSTVTTVLFFDIPAEDRAAFSMDEAFVELRAFRHDEGSLGRPMAFPVHFSP